jgi:hypothetical protein
MTKTDVVECNLKDSHCVYMKEVKAKKNGKISPTKLCSEHCTGCMNGQEVDLEIKEK